MDDSTATSLRMRRAGDLVRYSKRGATFCAFMFLLSASVRAADDGFYDVKIKSIEGFLVNRATGKLSENIVGAGPSVFISAGSANNTRTKSADDVLVAVHFERTVNQAFQPRVTIFALAHLKDGIPPNGKSIKVIQRQNEIDLGFDADKGTTSTATMLLKNVTCSDLDIVAVVDGGNTMSGDRAAVILPFVCKE